MTPPGMLSSDALTRAITLIYTAPRCIACGVLAHDLYCSEWCRARYRTGDGTRTTRPTLTARSFR